MPFAINGAPTGAHARGSSLCLSLSMVRQPVPTPGDLPYAFRYQWCANPCPRQGIFPMHFAINGAPTRAHTRGSSLCLSLSMVRQPVPTPGDLPYAFRYQWWANPCPHQGIFPMPFAFNGGPTRAHTRGSSLCLSLSMVRQPVPTPGDLPYAFRYQWWANPCPHQGIFPMPFAINGAPTRAHARGSSLCLSLSMVRQPVPTPSLLRVFSSLYARLVVIQR